MRSYLQAVLVGLGLTIILGFISAFPPDRTIDKKDKIPILISSCQFGKLDQEVRKFTISGNQSWVADGVISADGKSARLTWINFPEGRIADGQYAILENGEMRGSWQWADTAQYDFEDKLMNGSAEHLRK